MEVPQIRPLLRRYAVPVFVVICAVWGPWIYLFHGEMSSMGNQGPLEWIGFWIAVPAFGPLAIASLTGAVDLSWMPHWLADLMSSSFDYLIGGPLSGYHFLWGTLTIAMVGSMIYLAGRGRWWLLAMLVIGLLIGLIPVRMVMGFAV